MENRKLQAVFIAAVLALAGVALFVALVWTRTIPLGPAHEVFGRSEYIRMPMPEPAATLAAASPKLALENVDEEGADDGSETDDANSGVNNTRDVTFAEKFGQIEMEVSNPSWTDLTFDLASLGTASDQLAVSKEVTLDGRNVGSLRVYMGDDATVMVDPDDLLALLKNTAVDTSRLQQLAGRNRVAFGTIRGTGIDLRYRPAQDQLAIQRIERN